MKTAAAMVAALGVTMFAVAEPPRDGRASDGEAVASRVSAELGGPASPVAFAAAGLATTGARDNELVEEYCVRCHSERRRTGNLSLEAFDASAPAQDGVVAEKMIRKLRAGMMPPPGASRPAGDTLQMLAASLETRMDAAAERNPNPGGRTFQRLNRSDYEHAIHDLLDLDIDAGDYLPLDTKSENFDNIADVQMVSPTLLDSYLNAAAEISRLAVGDPNVLPSEVTYTVSGYVSQWDRVPGAPFGTRGGTSVTHNFPVDGSYVFRVVFEHTTTGEGFSGQIARFQQVELSIDGERVALLDVDQWMGINDPEGISMYTEPVRVTAGPKNVTAAFLKLTEGPAEDLVSPHEWSLADRHTGISGYGLTALPHLRDLIISGPTDVTGISETPSRRKIFSCMPTTASEERPCAREIVTRLGTEAYRRPLAERDIEALMRFYDYGVEEGGFEIGVRTALQALLASPHFVFRFEEAPDDVAPGSTYRVADSDLATRLSFFLWATPPDAELMQLAREGRLSDEDVLVEQVERMLDDPRAEALGTRFAAQWLRLQDLDKIHPDQFWFPDFDAQLKEAMQQETVLFFNHLVQEDRSFLEFFTADYTFVNERLARHYGMDGVTGPDFVRMQYPNDHRRGILGHGSVLTLTSHAGRTSPVLRGKWIMEVLLGTPPPPPPPGVPDLEETAEASDGKPLTTRQRMEQHRANPTCNSCHRFIDPIGLALDSYGVTGRWRIKENGVPLDTRGELYDGTIVAGPNELRDALLERPIPLVRTFTENLMAYALGRRVEPFDQPTVRAVARAAAENDYRMSTFIEEIVKSDAFQMQRAMTAAAETTH